MSERKFYPDNPEFAEEMNRLYAIESKYSTLKKSIEESTHSRFRIADWLDREDPPDNWFEEKLYALVEVET